MQPAGVVNNFLKKRFWIRAPHPLHFAVSSKIKYALDDIRSVFLDVYSFRIRIPEKRLSEFHASIIPFLQLVRTDELGFEDEA